MQGWNLKLFKIHISYTRENLRECSSDSDLMDETQNHWKCGIAGGKTAWELLSYEKKRKRITTSSAELDSLLGGGICLKEVTEICKFWTERKPF
jgi:predicted ATP-dependent serine protease